MSLTKETFIDYLDTFVPNEQRSMFGGTGIFVQGAMYALLSDEKLYIRGGEKLDHQLLELGCHKFKHVKRSTVAIVNYYDISDIYDSQPALCTELVQSSIAIALKEKVMKGTARNRRLRDLPNLRLTLERMMKKAGIEDVDAFYDMGAVDAYLLVKQSQGKSVDQKLLWMFAGAVEGCHWTLLNPSLKDELLLQLEQRKQFYPYQTESEKHAADVFN
ncbi:TfoX/Sxy family DNA transformation protein [Photobacterium sp. CCB-ST2H9]|uniref:TfoX/Sxy family DNA transformation protein n=1 Tax=unclassified Photobacterium TaxID=2628852 RepID=UPI0020030313|nr:TfoX/Sxy family DNA transformation protein [Photobacterium sp. CCB-ST2H9]UTM56393.1 TfoX/Sxy family DNA transformation protein [Photobacterium sp. CCB-ST2H9]